MVVEYMIHGDLNQFLSRRILDTDAAPSTPIDDTLRSAVKEIVMASSLYFVISRQYELNINVPDKYDMKNTFISTVTEP